MKDLLIKKGWAPFSVAVAYGLTAKAYGSLIVYDRTFHFIGGLAAAYFVVGCLLFFKNCFGRLDVIPFSLIAFSFVTTIAAFWEIFEFFIGIIFGVEAQLTLSETMMDLIMGCLGGISYIFFYQLVNRKNSLG